MLRSMKALALAASALALATTAALADYPEKPMKLMVGFSAGGGTDTTARGFASYIHEAPSMKGMPMVVVNLPGASGQKAAKQVVDGDADGYTLYMINEGTFAAAEMAAGEGAPVNAREDMVNLGCVTQLVTALQVRADDPAQSAEEFFSKAKESGQEIKWAASGAATMHALLGHLILDEMGVKHQVVPFKGGSKARAGLLSGSVDATFNGVNTVAGFENDIRMLATPAAERDGSAPDVPTFKELGLVDIGITGPMCLYAPKGIPAEAETALKAAVEHVAGIEGFGKFLKKNNLNVRYFSQDEANASADALYDKLGPIVQRVMGQ